mmetsp:Transcript_48660/g.128558  ORF Transcript_48660/g.128558 Transcript_48660/m.128558 type:complete len:219 (+) Transcript_48660:430-1086(+)
MFTTQLARCAAATLLLFMVSKLKWGLAIRRSVWLRACSGITLASNAFTSSRNCAGLFSIFAQPFQSSFLFSCFSRKPHAAQTSTHSNGGLVRLFSSVMAFLSRQSIAFLAASIAGIASTSSLSASPFLLSASVASAEHFSLSRFAMSCSTLVAAEAAVTCRISNSVATFLSSTCAMVVCRSSRSTATLSCTRCMMSRPFSRRPMLKPTLACLPVSIFT